MFLDSNDLNSRTVSLNPQWITRFFGKLDGSRPAIPKATLVVLICWLPYLIASIPGVYWNDTTWQIVQFSRYADPIIDHYPFLDTIIIGGAADLSNRLFGNFTVLLYVLVVIQSVLAAFAFANMCCKSESLGVSYKARAGLLTFFAVFPFFPLFFVTLCKDTLFTPFFIFYCFYLACFIFEKQRTYYVDLVRIMFIGIICSLTRKTGIYICAGSLLFCVFMNVDFKQKAKILACVVFIAAISQIGVPSFVKNYREISPGGKQEIFALPLQQVANVIRSEPSLLTSEDWDIVANTYPIGVDKLSKAYDWKAADGVKGYSQPKHADYIRFLQLWVKLGWEKPGSYLGAWLGLNAGWFTPGYATILPVATMQNHAKPIEAFSGWRAQPISGDKLEKFGKTISLLPLVDFLFSKYLWASVLPAFLVYVLFDRRLRKKRMDLARGC